MREANIRYQVMWDRLTTIVEEQARTLIRTGFSVSTREAGDVSAGVFDLQGRMLAQAVTGTPGHINSMAMSVGHFIEKFPIKKMKEGDVFLTNDPWKGTGHLHDIVVVTPTFKNGRVVALFACTTHVVDIGGIGMAPDGKQIYHEGLYIPLMYLFKAGQLNETLIDFVHYNCRESKQVEGDIYALANCNDVGSDRLRAMMVQYKIEDLNELAETIIESTRNAMRAAISKLPITTTTNTMKIDGYDEEIVLKAKLSVVNDTIVIDYEGSSPISDFGINVPKCYTDAYTSFGVKCVVAPEVPNNAGSLAHIIVKAPEGCILNAPHPCAVVARSSIGHMLPDVVFGCLHQLLPGRVPAEGTSCLWNLRLGAGHGITTRDPNTKLENTTFTAMSFHSGGAGARPNKDGLSATPFPSGVRNVPVEVLEAITPIVIWRKELRQNSGGAGQFRGGLGQRMVVGNREKAEFAIFGTFDRVKNPARGRDGGKPGATGSLTLTSGKKLKGMGRQVIPMGEELIIEMPGGGGYGNPKSRDRKKIMEDIRAGLVSADNVKEYE
ncbi:MAG: hydantoinase B/oxoprolinase family protein [Pseudomonadota bacterium]|nr:hydantoinase B/oxoprolinase family protein [Pseudomonadota bacterium]|tara:strand:+ start:254 stop:1906 length:1653 start_codon:yes stop_codon:yes gene_type:complete